MKNITIITLIALITISCNNIVSDDTEKQQTSQEQAKEKQQTSEGQAKEEQQTSQEQAKEEQANEVQTNEKLDAQKLANLMCESYDILYVQTKTKDLSYKKQRLDEINTEFEAVTNNYNPDDKGKLEEEVEKICETKCSTVIEELKHGNLN